jgi:eukaryotic-like serine/threonine-protein kinase
MERVEGTTLAALIRERGPMAPLDVVDLAGQVCAALDAAHRAGLVHRDVTPGNILVRPDGRVKLTDFGIARVVGGATTTAAGSVLGTPAYMSPEQVRGNRVDARSDLYSAGCCVYAMLTGRPPFDAEGAIETAFQHVSQPPPRPSAVQPGVPPALEQVVLTAMAKDPEDRYPDAEAMREALAAAGPRSTLRVGAPEAAAAGRGRSAAAGRELVGKDPDAPDPEEVDEGVTRRRIGVVLIVLAAAVLLAVAALLLYQRLAG